MAKRKYSSYRVWQRKTKIGEKEVVSLFGWVGYGHALSKAKVSRSHTVARVVFAMMSKGIRYFVKEGHRKYYGNNTNSEQKYSQYLLSTYHMGYVFYTCDLI